MHAIAGIREQKKEAIDPPGGPSREGLQLRMQSMARSSADTYVPAKILMEVGRSKAENGGYIR
ncbi:hypothetical protein [Methanothrix sp.]|jgi:hypothetical protein|uniref:hypothetical protein n=1 Tax=Methanothrix sp. TaxID=90426 RepID=UPI001BD32A7B